MDEAEKILAINALAKSLEEGLLERYGPIMTGDDLLRALGYRSPEAFRQSVVRHTVAIPVFDLEHRRGKFALVKDVARHLAEQRFKTECRNPDYRDEGGDP